MDGEGAAAAAAPTTTPSAPLSLTESVKVVAAIKEVAALIRGQGQQGQQRGEEASNVCGQFVGLQQRVAEQVLAV